MTAGRNVNTKSKSWNTPKKIVDDVNNVFGGIIDLDPCSNEFSVVDARVKYDLPYNDGLKDSWDYDKIFVNPPYGADKERNTRIINWFKRVSESYENGSEIIMLVPVAPNTKHWKDYIFPKATSICFLYDTRFKFWIDGFEEKQGAPMPVCVIYYGKNDIQFAKYFQKHGAVVSFDNVKLP